MLSKRIILIVAVSLLLGILLCLSFGISGYTGIKMLLAPPPGDPYQHARRSVVITIDTSQRQVFFDQLRKFAAKNGFAIQIDNMPRGPDDFLVTLTRGDIRISGANPFFAPSTYELGFFDADRYHPVPESVFDPLVNDLKSFMSAVPGAVFSVTK